MTTTQPKRQPIPFGKYLLLDRINIGGMAEVWRGKQFGASGFERLVAIKRILPNIAEDDEFISMFIDEAKISVQLTHANIASIYELGNIVGSYFISMEYIPGKDMRAIFDRCRKKGEPAPVPLVAFCVSKMCEGLDYAHRKKDGMGRDMNIVHRDISPQNVLISYEGEVKVIDFGIAKAAGKATKTQAGILKGKFGYMSPEQIRGLPLDRRSDVFAIGVCLYEMLTGERLFVGDSDFSVLEKVRKAEVPSPSTYTRRIPEALERIVLKALAKDVDERYQYASELGDDLQRFLITSDTIFSRKDLAQYMKSTFAEDVEREKQRLLDYADIKPPEGMQAALEAASFNSPIQPSAPPPAPVPVVQPVAPQPRMTGSMPAVAPGGVRRSPTLAALPKLTAATAAPAPDDDEGGATQLVSSDHEFADTPEPTTQPGAAVGRAITPLEIPSTPGHVEDEEPVSGRTAVIPPPAPLTPPVGPPRLSHANIPVVRPSTAVPTLSPSDAPPPHAASGPAPRSSRGGGLPRMTRDVPVVDGPQAAARPPPPVAPPAPVAPAYDDEDDVDAQARPTGAMPTVGGLPPIPRKVLFGGIGAVAVLLLALIGFAMSGPGVGYVLVDLQDVPSEVRSRVQVRLDTQLVPLEGGSPTLLREVPAGKVMVVVSAEGYKPFTKTVEVAAGKDVTPVQAVLESLVRTAALVLTTEPSTAEVKVDGRVVREQGKSAAYIKDVPINGAEWVVEVSAPGHKPASKRVPVSGGGPVEVSLKLEPLVVQVAVKVESKPAGATIFVDGKDMGAITPAVVQVPPSARQLTLKLKCHNEAEVDVPDAAPGNEPATASVSLKRQPRCR
ncbi:serine/threonine-protein kinase [Corallococcus macrosporus]|uniref:Serine/threonine protein kinase n=1 Tax=Myxococcus fulvus (strain ATCC BAA-855 / HW-1) TaxID=483219 RepID=F8CN84_MYXFH|nr:serine/threonine-protein kinase [Corallococcus macrosporus]AEI69068.1 serine/threonine protein kinase [Corallococcus macrosporus]